MPASSNLTVDAGVPAGSVPASIDHDVNVLPNIDASAVFPVGAPVSPVASDVLARCLSPGPFYDGPAIDRESLPWPLSVCPDWPINAEWLDFAFEKVTFRPLTVDIEPSDIPDIAL